jgi:microcystin-dependent protein
MKKLLSSPLIAGVLFLLGCIMISVHLSDAQVYLWSQTATSNNHSDPSVEFPEGMAPAAFDANTRAFMAAVSKWRDDTSGPALSSTYSGGVYSLTTSQGFAGATTAQAEGSRLCFQASATNVGGDSISVDGGSAIPIFTGSVAVPGGVIIAGSPYCVQFNLAGTKFLLFSYYGSTASSTMPIGAVIDYIGPAGSSNFALTAGQCISQSTYATLFALIGSTFGSCSAGLFSLPDLRGRTVAGVANMNGVDNGLMSGCGTQTTLGGKCGAQGETIAQGNLPNYTLPSSLGFSGSTQTWTANNTNQIPQNSSIGKQSGGTDAVVAAGNAFQPTITFTPSGSITGSASLGGGGQQLPTVQPTVLTNKIIRVQ